MSLDPDASIARLKRHAWWAIALGSLAGLFAGVPFFLGVVMGGLLAMLNFEAIGRLVKNVTAKRPGWLSWLGVFGWLLRYILWCIALFVIISVWHANVVGLALGFSAPVVAVFVESLYAFRESKRNLKHGGSDHDEA